MRCLVAQDVEPGVAATKRKEGHCVGPPRIEVASNGDNADRLCERTDHGDCIANVVDLAQFVAPRPRRHSTFVQPFGRQNVGQLCTGRHERRSDRLCHAATIHFKFTMNTMSNIEGLEIEPFSARSVILSALLGLHPPVLPVQALIGLAVLFDIRPGTTRTSLSRMVANGELTVAEGQYALAGRLLERQREQDAGRRATTQEWNGDWITAIASGDRRTKAERRALRRAMVGSRLWRTPT